MKLAKVKKNCRTVFIVEDSLYMRALIKMALHKSGYVIVGESGTGKESIELITALRPDLVTLDINLPDMSGVDVLFEVRKHNVASHILVVSNVNEKNILKKMEVLGAMGYVRKPFESKNLVSAVSRVFSEYYVME